MLGTLPVDADINHLATYFLIVGYGGRRIISQTHAVAGLAKQLYSPVYWLSQTQTLDDCT